MAITLTHTEVAYLRKKLRLSARALGEIMGIKSFNDIYNYEADPAQVKSAKPMPALHCTLLVMIVEYQDKFNRLPPMEYLKEVNLDYCARDIAKGIDGPTSAGAAENWPSAREIRAFQRQEAAKKAKKD